MTDEAGAGAIGALTAASTSALLVRLTQFVRARFPHLPDYEDVVQETMLDLQTALARPGIYDESAESITRLAFVIAKRRAVDQYRSEMRTAALLAGGGLSDEPASPSAEAVATYKQQLAAVLAFIATMEAGDRFLLLDEAVGTARTQAMSPAERKRLSRLRTQLRAAIGEKGAANDKRGKE